MIKKIKKKYAIDSKIEWLLNGLVVLIRVLIIKKKIKRNKKFSSQEFIHTHTFEWSQLLFSFISIY